MFGEAIEKWIFAFLCACDYLFKQPASNAKMFLFVLYLGFYYVSLCVEFINE